MNRTLVLIGTGLFIIAGLASAQQTGLSSLQSDFSFGVFTNELDSALSVVETGRMPGFSQLTHPYFFGGIGNLEKIANNAGLTGTTPAWLGYYQPGEMPWSAFLGVYHTAGATGSDTLTATSTTTPAVTSGTTSTTTAYNSQTVEKKTVGTAYGTINDRLQFLTRFANINFGLFAQVNLSDSSAPASNFTQTTTNYYNSVTSGAPTATLNNTVTTTQKGLNINNTYTFQVPVFMKVGDLGNFGLIGLSLNSQDTSTDATSTTTVPAAPSTVAGGFTDTEVNGITQTKGTTTLSLQYTGFLPAFLAQHSSDYFFAGVQGVLNLHNQVYSEKHINQAYTYSGPGATAQKSTRTETSPEITTTITGATDYNFLVKAGQAFYFDLGQIAQFGLIPELDVSYKTSQNGNVLTQAVATTHTDVDNNGDFTSTGDTSSQTTQEYANTAEVAGAAANLVTTNTFMTQLVLPVALKVAPQGWVFGFTLGAQPTVSMTSTTVTTATTYIKTQTTVNSTVGTGTTGTTIQNNPDPGSVTTKATSWAVSANHNVGVEVLLSDAVKVDINVLAAVAGGVWDFRNLVVQGIVALK